MIKYKLTYLDMQTHRGYQWELGVWHEAKGDPEQPLCSDGWLHCYDSPLLAVLHNPIHGNIRNPRLFEVEVEGDSKDDRGMKRGFRRMKLVRELDVPEITIEQRVKYAIYCTLEVCQDADFERWAYNWLSGRDRSAEAASARAKAYMAAEAAYDATGVSAYSTYMAAAYAAEDAALAADINLIELAERAMG